MKFLKTTEAFSANLESYKLLIEFKFTSYISLFDRVVLGIIRLRYPIQGIPFKYGLKITNIGDKTFLEGKIDKFMISEDYSDQTYLCPIKEVGIGNIKPGKSVTIMFGMLKNHFQGPISLSCSVYSNNPKHIVELYQKNSSKNRNEKCFDYPNKWFWCGYIEKRADLLLQNTNMILILLALMTFLKMISN